jgi:hypothetical protein
MNPTQRERWERARVKGKNHFIWMVGVVRWGLISGFVISTFTYLNRANWDVRALLEMDFVSHLGFMLLTFAAFGYVWGWTVWKLTEKRYLEEQENE